MKALCAMSGGVDSSVAAYLVKKAGYDCVGCTMRLYSGADDGGGTGTCCSLDDVEDARSAAYRIGMQYHVFNFTDDFDKEVISRFVNGYFDGFTPNPCIDCNRYLKFGKLFERARILSCDRIVTGHYASIVEKDGKYFLKKGADSTKDQSYVLYFMTQEQLSHTLFPLGGLTKTKVRSIAAQIGLCNAEKPDSQDICFVPDSDYAGAVERFSGRRSLPGDMLDVDCGVIGRHKGIIRYTIGQHRGLGIPSEDPLYVCRISARENTITVGRSEDVFYSAAEVGDFNWISGDPPSAPIACKVKTRYRDVEKSAAVFPTGEKTVRIVFDEPKRAVAPGQAAVLYDGDAVLGGGVITETEK